jgi:putative salt-induced outer membrane protein YdiY
MYFMRHLPLTFVLLALGTIATLCTAAETAPPDRIVLAAGDTLIGTVIAQTVDVLTLQHPALGELTIARSDIKEWTHLTSPPGIAAKAVEAARVASVASLTLAQPAPVVKAEEPAVKWSGHIDMGANGASGNSDTNNMYAAGGFKRETDLSTLTLEANYRLATDSGSTTANRFFDIIRYERVFSKGSRRSYFAQTTQEADEFKDYDFRLTASGGVEQRFIDTEKTKLKAYAGLGAAREFGGSDTGVSPFALFGTAYSRKLNDRVTFKAGSEFEPRFDDVGEYRLRGNASIAVDLNDSGSLKLKLGLEDEYDSDPGAAKKNDFYYTASIVYSF